MYIVTTVNAMTDKVSGVAELDGTIYVVCHGSKSIDSFHSNNDTPRRHKNIPIVIEGLQDACDLVVCLKTRRLYVADQRGIYVVSPTSHVKVNRIKNFKFKSQIFDSWCINSGSREFFAFAVNFSVREF